MFSEAAVHMQKPIASSARTMLIGAVFYSIRLVAIHSLILTASNGFLCGSCTEEVHFATKKTIFLVTIQLCMLQKRIGLYKKKD